MEPIKIKGRGMVLDVDAIVDDAGARLEVRGIVNTAPDETLFLAHSQSEALRDALIERYPLPVPVPSAAIPACGYTWPSSATSGGKHRCDLPRHADGAHRCTCDAERTAIALVYGLEHDFSVLHAFDVTTGEITGCPAGCPAATSADPIPENVTTDDTERG